MPSTPPPSVPSAGTEQQTAPEQRSPSPEVTIHALASVARIVSSIRASPDLPATLQAVLESVRELLGADMGTIWLLQDPPGELVLAASAGLAREESASLPPRVPVGGESLSAQVARARAPICLGQMEAAGPGGRADRWRLGLASVLGVALRVGDRLVGTLLVGARHPQAFGAEAARLAGAIADVVAPAMDRAALLDEVERLYAGAMQAKARADALAEIGRALASARELDAALDLIAEETLAATESQACGIYQWDAAEALLQPVAVRGLSEGFRREFALVHGEGVSGLVLRGGEPAWTSDVLADPRFQFSPRTKALVSAEGFRSVLVVPIRLKAGFFGTLVTYRWRPHQFTEEEVRFQAALADQAAVAIENARLFERQREAARNAEREKARAEALAAVGRAISASLDLDEVLALLVERAAAATGADAASVLQRDAATDIVRFRQAHGLSTQYWQALAIPPGAGIVGAALGTGQPQWSPDIQTDARFPVPDDVRALNTAEGVRGLLSVPVRGPDGPYGVLNLYRRDRHAFDEEEIAFAIRIAEQAALAIENARLYQEERSRSRDLAALIRAGRAVNSSLDLSQILETIVASAVELTGASVAYLQLVEEGGLLVSRASAGPLQRTLADEVRFAPISVGESFSGGVAARGESLWVPEMTVDPRQIYGEFNARHGIRCYLGVPILAGAQVLGVLSVIAPEGKGTEGRRPVLESLAGQAGIALENARLHAEAVRKRAEAEALQELGRVISSTLESDEIFRVLIERTCQVLGVSRCALWEARQDGEELRLRQRRSVGLNHGAWEEVPLRVGEGTTGACIARRAPVWTADILHDPGIQLSEAGRARVIAEGYRAVCSAPILLPDGPFGVLTIYRDEPHAFDAREVGLLSAFAGQAAIAIQNARLYAETRRAYEDLQAAQEQLVQVEKLRALGEMAGGVAHDFNNLLAAILGRAQLLRLRDVDPQVHEGLAVIERAALDGAETVRRILGFARVRPEAQYAPLDLADLIPQALEVTRPRWKDEAQARGAAIEAVLALEPVPAVLGNAAELREVIVNLVFNAVDAMPHGGRLTVGAHRLLRPTRASGAVNPRRETLADEAGASQELVEVFVRDTGVGMPDRVRRRAFEPFFTTKGAKGTGLGLSVVYGIVSRHGGEVLLESQQGAGTTVMLRLPATDRPAQDPGVPGPSAAARQGRIVVVDDEDVLVEALAELLRLQHHQVHAFTDPRRALEHLAREPADLLFTDLGMSEMSGWDVARRARELHPALSVVLVTGWGHAIDPAQVRERRVNAVVAKPFRVEDILQVVAELLAAHPAG
ncbi:MAG TPA: GAF domain-containing protein [Candidatus Methylomirabilis sp.]